MMDRRRTIFSPFMWCSLLILMIPTLPVSAMQSADSTPVQPEVLIAIHQKGKDDGTRFEATLDPGQSTELISVMTNFGSNPIELRTFSADVVPSTNGGLSMAAYDSEKTGRTLWMAYDTEEFTLQPGESIERTLKISVPDGTPPGQYVNAVALETVNPINPDADTAFLEYFRKVVSVYITVPGDLESRFEFGEPEIYSVLTQMNVRIPVINSGQLRLDLEGEVVITDPQGSEIHRQAVRLAPIYMGQTIDLVFGLPSAPAAGEYFISYKLTDITTSVVVEEANQAITIPELEDTESSPISFANVSIVPNADPISFANVSLEINLNQPAIRSTRLTLSVYHNGEFLEDFVLAENLSLETGTTTVSQRYIPVENWQSGTYTFDLKVESTGAGSEGVLIEEQDVATLEVP